MTLAHVTDHATVMPSRLMGEFQGKLRIEALVRAFAIEFQELEDVFYSLVVERWLDSAVGAQLDLIGRLVGRPRRDIGDDETYRIVLRAWVRANRSNGTGNDILDVAGLAVANDVELREYSPQSFVLDVFGALAADAGVLADLVRRARGAGVRAQLVYSTVADDETFTFASGDVEEASSTQGWADDAQTTGGRLAEALEA